MPSPAFKLRIFESEYKEIEDLVLMYPNIETGGDLFGLWTRDADPVVQLIIGPGQKCRRTSVSFHQDTDYLQNVGTYLNTSFMLCHIGSWHSHHQLSLTHPSAGDRSTVCNNFPVGLQRYIMIIANIVSDYSRTGTKSAVIHPYMFTYEGLICDEGSVEVISSASPFRRDLRLQGEIAKGTERDHSTLNRPYVSHPSTKSPLLHDREFCLQDNKHRYGTEKWDVQKPSEADQWYSSAAGQVKLMKINEGIMALTQNEDKLQFTRNKHSYDLTLEFVHNSHKWFIEFPKSYDKDDARIFYPSEGYLNPSSNAFILSKDVVRSVLNFCGCESCKKAGRKLSPGVVLENSELECEMAATRTRDKMQEPSLGFTEEEPEGELSKAKENESYLTEDSCDERMKRMSTPERVNFDVLRSFGQSKSPRSDKQRYSPYRRVRNRFTKDLCIKSETDQKLKAVACSSVLLNESMGKPVTSQSPKNELRRAEECDEVAANASKDNHDEITNVGYVGDREQSSSRSETDTSDNKLRKVTESIDEMEHHNQESPGTIYDSNRAERSPSPNETGMLYDQRLLGTLESDDLTECDINQVMTGTSFNSVHEQSVSPGGTGMLCDQWQLGRVDIKDTSARYNIQEQTNSSYDGDFEQSFSSDSSTTFERFVESYNQERLADASGQSAEPQSGSSRESSLTATRSTVTFKEIQQWYKSRQGEEKLRTIYEQIVSDLKVLPSDVGFSRQENSHDLILGFHHNGCNWTVEFPKLFDEEDAKIESALSNSIVYSKNIVKGVQELSRCNECEDGSGKGEMAEATNQQQDSNLARSCRIPTVTKHTQSSRERQNDHSGISRKSESHSYVCSTPVSPYLDVSPSSSNKLEGNRNCSPRRRKPKTNRATNDKAKSILNKVRSLAGPDNCWSEPNAYVPGKTFSFYFNHGPLKWVILFHKNFPQISAKLFKRENNSRTFCKDVTPANALETVRDVCKFRK